MKKTLLLLTSATLLALPLLAYAQTSAYRPLIQLPITTGGAPGWQGYIDLLYATAISLAALLAVMKIVIAGAKYMFSDVITNKAEAKNDIQGALLGLLLILGAVILLNLINPQLTNTTINIDRIQPTPTVASAAGVKASQSFGITDTCVKLTNPTDSSGKNQLTRADVTACPEADKLRILTAFENSCKAKPGAAAASGGKSSGVVGCAVPNVPGVDTPLVSTAKTNSVYTTMGNVSTLDFSNTKKEDREKEFTFFKIGCSSDYGQLTTTGDYRSTADFIATCTKPSSTVKYEDNKNALDSTIKPLPGEKITDKQRVDAFKKNCAGKVAGGWFGKPLVCISG